MCGGYASPSFHNLHSGVQLCVAKRASFGSVGRRVRTGCAVGGKGEVYREYVGVSVDVSRGSTGRQNRTRRRPRKNGSKACLSSLCPSAVGLVCPGGGTQVKLGIQRRPETGDRRLPVRTAGSEQIGCGLDWTGLGCQHSITRNRTQTQARS